MLFIKYSKDKNKLREILEKHRERFQSVERRAADVINVLTSTKLIYDEKERKIDMCQAILEMRKESEEIGELRRAKESARRFYEMGIGVERVAEGVGCDVETVKKWLELPQ